MRKTISRVILSMALAGSLVSVAAPASASTCAVADPTLEFVVCDVVVNPTMRVVCTVVNWAKLDCFM